jgi:hypothetical protein
MPTQAPPLNLGSRLELLVDDHLIASLTGGARLQLHQPVRRDIVFQTDAPWEGNACAYHSVFQDGPIYRLYYHGLHYRFSGKPAQALADHAPNLCTAESDDGVHWRRPEVGLFEFDGSKANNIVLTPEHLAGIEGDPAHAHVFKDANPDCPPEARYKCVVVSWERKGLYVLQSPDGLHFTPMTKEPVITEGAFDSQNLMFWDSVRGEYRCYLRGFRDDYRDILTATSPDCLHFTQPQWLDYPGAPRQQLYTSQMQPYYRAPHLFLGFPARYTERGWEDPLLDLPGLDERLARAETHPRYGMSITDTLFMSSRDGQSFHRWSEAFIRPGPRQRESWVYGDNYLYCGMFETPSATEDAPNELSLYASDGYWEGVSNNMRRYTLRIDGFVSATAPFAGGELLTHPFLFAGGNLALNLETSGAGGVQVECQEADGTPIAGYTLADCPPIMGDHLRHIVRWRGSGGDVRPLAGRPVRLRITISDADVYSLQFVPYAPEPERPDLAALGLSSSD